MNTTVELVDFGWNLPVTYRWLTDESAYTLLPAPEESIAERLIMIAHMAKNREVWGQGSGNTKRYWPALGEHASLATNQVDVAAWWTSLAEEMKLIPLASSSIRHEKNLLCRPKLLPVTCVDDEMILEVIRMHYLDLIDRVRMWDEVRLDVRKKDNDDTTNTTDRKAAE